MFPNLIYRRNMIDQSVISATDNLMCQQQHQNSNNNSKTNNNKKKIETWKSMPNQNESSLFQLNTSLLNHLFLTTSTVSQPNTTTITTSSDVLMFFVY